MGCNINHNRDDRHHYQHDRGFMDESDRFMFDRRHRMHRDHDRDWNHMHDRDHDHDRDRDREFRHFESERPFIFFRPRFFR